MAERHMVAMFEQPVRPVPPGGVYSTRFGEPGAKDATEITLESLDEPGYKTVFTAMGKSNANRLRSLLEEAVAHIGTEAGQAGYVHPVILVTPGHYFNQDQGREIFHFDFTVIDWMHENGDLWSKQAPAVGGPGTPAPWEAEGAEPAVKPKRRSR
jgi:hypothetical protein